MKKRIYKVGVQNWTDCYGKKRYDPVIVHDMKTALMYADLINKWDREGGHPKRKVKVMSWVVDNCSEFERSYHPELS